MKLPVAIKEAVRTCMRKNILLSFLKDNGSEVENMLFTEWNMKDALEVAREEGEANGMERGMEKVFSLLRQGYSVDEAEKILVTREAGIRV